MARRGSDVLAHPADHSAEAHAVGRWERVDRTAPPHCRDRRRTPRSAACRGRTRPLCAALARRGVPAPRRASSGKPDTKPHHSRANCADPVRQPHLEYRASAALRQSANSRRPDAPFRQVTAPLGELPRRRCSWRSEIVTLFCRRRSGSFVVFSISRVSQLPDRECELNETPARPGTRQQNLPEPLDGVNCLLDNERATTLPRITAQDDRSTYTGRGRRSNRFSASERAFHSADHLCL